MGTLSSELAVTNGQNPNVSVPGTIDFNAPQQQPGNTVAPAPVVPSNTPANVSGGQASFNSTTAALADMVKWKTSEFAASNDARIANDKVDLETSAKTSILTEDTLSAMQRVQRIKQMPEDITQILGIFDKDWNIGYQAGRIDINETKAKDIAATGAAKKIMNNQMPALLANASAAAQAIFNAQVEANKLYVSQEHEDNARTQIGIDKARLSIAQSQEARARTEWQVNSMPEGMLAFATADIAKNGEKSKFFSIGGHIEHRLASESQLSANAQSAQVALQSNNIDLFNKKATNAASYVPATILGPMINQAEAKGQAVIALPTGQKDKDGKDIMLPVPLRLAKDGLVMGMQSDQKGAEIYAADLTQKANIFPRITNLTNTAQAFVGMDPRAANVFVHASEIVKSINGKNPASINMVDALLKQQEASMEQIIKENAEKFPSKQSQAAIIVAGRNGGKFDVVGGTSVAADSVGNPGLNTAGRYSSAWGILNTATANELSKQGLGFGTVNNDADAQSTLALALANPKGHEKIGQIARNIMADPQKMKPVRDAIKEKITDNAIGGVFQQLAQTKDANPIWANLAAKFRKDGLADFNGKDGTLDVSKVIEAMEQATLVAKAHGNAAADYSTTFLRGLQKYGASGGDTAGQDSTYSISDRALEAALFNGDPAPNVLNGLHYDMRRIVNSVKQQFNARIQEDLNGTTERNAYADMARLGQIGGAATDAYVGDPSQIAAIAKKTGKNLKNLPSATGTGLTVGQIQQIMSAGN